MIYRLWIILLIFIILISCKSKVENKMEIEMTTMEISATKNSLENLKQSESDFTKIHKIEFILTDINDTSKKLISDLLKEVNINYKSININDPDFVIIIEMKPNLDSIISVEKKLKYIAGNVN